MEEKILLDTDIGDDIDDAYALGLLLAEKANLIGITTVYRNSIQRAKIAGKILQLFHRRIPVYAGEDIPKKQPLFRFECSDQGKKAVVPHYISAEMAGVTFRRGAVDFILRTLEKFPNRITLLAIGPLTNLARAYEKDPDAFRLAKKIMLMGGNYSEKEAEWNILCDPEAAERVFSSGVPITAVGIDVTRNCTFDDAMLAFLRNLNEERFRLLVRMTEIWIRQNREKNQPPTMHDPLTAEALLFPSLLQYRYGNFKVETEGSLRGVTLPDSRGVKIKYAVQANYGEFFNRIRKLFGKEENHDG